MTLLKKTIFAASIIVVAAVATVFAIAFVFTGDTPQGRPALALTEHNVRGWAWSSTVGWISFNCITDDSCDNSNYGVHIDESTGEFSGYAWNDKVGWISFNRSDTGAPPFQPFRTAGFSQIAEYKSGEIEGWGKILSMGDDGWIKFRKFSSDGGAAYGVDVASDGTFSGWAWNGNNNNAGIGWISTSCSNESTCGSVDYGVWLDLPPEVESITTTQPDYCLPDGFADARTHILGWAYFEAAEQEQTAYRVQVSTNQNFNNTTFDTNKTSGSVVQRVVDGSDGLAYGTDYYWRVRVWDESDQASDWSETGSFTTSENNYPDVGFSYSPADPRALEDVEFSEEAIVYDGQTPSYFWEFTNASETSTTTPNPVIQLYSTNDSSASLTVTDSNGYACTIVEDPIGAGTSLPIWRETQAE